ncbi:hypothetical protein KIN20_018786 [Parelaphostrongylus tenuis]|uniref:Uncharacterized protein n=1 Tax=Parelaphostrongylus tenuis TaxID=148309 RepID=A0AAD5QUM7_PARTN|nr:hypothetical protein KIN20_018786 [Parelaphostrongylus tenuis]
MKDVNMVNCIVVSNTVTRICSGMRGKKCMPGDPQVADITAIPNEHLTISGTLSTTNIVMASWSNAIWRRVVRRAVGMLASGPFGSHFFSAVVTVGGN